MEIEIDIKATLKALKAKGLTQIYIGMALGCSQANISYLKNVGAKRARPSATVVEGLKKLKQRHCVTDDDLARAAASEDRL